MVARSSNAIHIFNNMRQADLWAINEEEKIIQQRKYLNENWREWSNKRMLKTLFQKTTKYEAIATYNDLPAD